MEVSTIEQVHNLVKEFLNRPIVKSKIQKALESQNRRFENLSETDVMRLLKELDLYNELENEIAIIEKFRPKPISQTLPEPLQQTQPKLPIKGISNSRFGLGFKVVRGRAFVDFLSPPSNRSLHLQICFDGHRRVGNKVAAQVDPPFDSDFFFSFTGRHSRGDVSLENLSKLDSPVSIALIISDDVTGDKQLYSLKSVEWRFILSHGVVNLNIELVSYKNSILLRQEVAGKRMTMGTLQIQMELITPSRPIYIPERILNDQMSLETKTVDSNSMRFYEYSNNWWKEYKETNPQFENRIVKMYCETDNNSYKPVITMVRPLTQVRGLDSPYHAARFVSLIPFEAAEKPGGQRIEVWHSFHSLLSKGKGDVEDHAILLASLLLGFGLKAFVVCGETVEGTHSWVLTLGLEGKAIFWEPLTGQRLDQSDPRVIKFYRRIGCVFNHKSFFANLQIDDSASKTKFDLEIQNQWKKMNSELISVLECYQTDIEILKIAFNSEIEMDLESELRKSLIDYRKELGFLSTKFDIFLESILSTALTNYEFERCTGFTFGQDEFQDSIKEYIPDEHTFKAFPIQFTHRNPKQMFSALKANQICNGILQSRGDSVNFALRVKMVEYPDEIFAVWVIVGVRYLA